MLRTRLMLLVVLAAALALPGVARAQTTGVYAVDYFDNANNSYLPDGTVRITNVGIIPGTGTGVGDQCALLYVFDAVQELAECCGCRITPNGLLKLSVNNNLAGNPLTGVRLCSGTIVMVPSLAPNTTGTVPMGSSAGCDPGLPAVQTLPTGPGFAMEGWSTHIQDNGAITEGNFIAGINNTAINGYFSAAEVAALASKCRLSNELGGSGSGLCNCPMGNDPPAPSPLPLSTPTPAPTKLSAPATIVAKSSTPKSSAPTSPTPISTDRKLIASTSSPAPTTQR
jgi:hypothetical protein